MNNIIKKTKIIKFLFIITLIITNFTYPSKKNNVLLITIDTLRADYLGAIGEYKIKTPFIDSIANNGLLFTNVFTAVPLTLPSHISILTGTYPSLHGVRNNGQFFNNISIKSIASILKNNGYNTYAITASYVLHSRFGLSKDFDYYLNVHKSNSLKHSISTQFIEKKAEEVISDVSNLIPDIKTPFFLWVHFFDPHAPYEPPHKYSHGSNVESYIGEIEYTDYAIGKLLYLLKKNNLSDNLIICITSDHGESLGEHKETTHGHFLYNSTLRVPLILQSNSITPNKIHNFVSTIDIAPTILDMLNFSIPSYMQGSSLIKFLNSNKHMDKKIIYSETLQPFLDNNWAPLFSIITERKKYIYAPKPELYDLKIDTYELNNIINDASNNSYLLKLKPFLKFHKFNQKIDAQSKEILISLGYASGTTSYPLNINKLMNFPDPKDTIDYLELIHLAMDKINSSSFEDALKILLPLSEKNNSNTRIYYLLSLIYKYKNDYPAAITYMKKASNLNSDYLSHYYLLLAEYNIKNKKLAEAEQNYLSALKENPFETAVYYNLAQLAYLKKDLLSAKKYLYKTIELEPENPDATNNLFNLLIKEKQYDEAEILLIKYFNIVPNNELNLNNLIKLYINKNDYQNAYKFLKKSLSINPANENNYLLMINTCLHLKKTEESINYRYKLAEFYLQEKEKDKALNQLKEIIKIDPSNNKAIALIKQIQH